MTMFKLIFKKIAYLFHGCPPQEDLFQFALDGLDSPERDRVRGHISDCRPCQEQIKEYAWVSEGIALTAPLAPAPEGLCDKVKARIRNDPQQHEPLTRVLQLGGNLHGWPLFWMRLGPVFAVMSLVMSMVALGAVFSRGGNSAAPGQVLSQAQALFSHPRARTVSLKGEGPEKCMGKLVMAEGLDVMLIQVENLKPCRQGRVYTVWFCEGEGKACRLAGFQTEDLKATEYLLHLAKPLEKGGGKGEIRVMLGHSGVGAEKMEGELRLKGQVEL